MRIFVDGCCNKTLGTRASITNDDCDDLVEEYWDFLSEYDFIHWFQKKYRNLTTLKVDFDDGVSNQNNGAEMIAAIIGLMIAIEFGYKEVYSDSTLVVNHWSRKNPQI